MKIAYFDCFAGISGDMTIGALLDAGFEFEKLKSELKKLHLEGYELKAEKTERNHIGGTKFSVLYQEDHSHRHLKDIVEMIQKSELSSKVQEQAIKIFTNLAEAEAHIHGTTVDKIHFHEVGAIDSIVDIVGILICLEGLEIEQVYSSRIHVGSGFVECQHGKMPLPAPATANLLKKIPTYSKGIESELTTPTGAAFLSSLCEKFGPLPYIETRSIGYGAGSRVLPDIPNLLRVYIGDRQESFERDEATLIQANIDDMNPEIFEYVSNLILQEGAFDVYMAPVIMKKNRPGTVLNILTPEEKKENILSILFAETTTLGVRMNQVIRKRIMREILKVKTKFGDIKVKIGREKEKILNIAPEYESCKKIALEKNIPLKEVYRQAIIATQNL